MGCIWLDGKPSFAGQSAMNKPNLLLFILAIVVLLLFLPSGFFSFLVGTLWQVSKIVLVLIAIIIIIAYFRKKKS